MKNCYVYGLFRPDTGGIFYVGMGKGDRAYQHVRSRKRGRSYKDNIICKLIDDRGYPEIPVVFFREELSRDEAIELEIALIYAIGRRPHGPLTNVVRGGEGLADPSPEFRARHGRRMRKVLADPEIRAVMSEKAKARERTPEFEAKRIAAGRTPQARARKSAAGKARLRTPEFEAKRLAAVTSPEAVAKRKASMGEWTWITNGTQDRQVKRDEANELPEGWRLGHAHGRVSDAERQRRADEKAANRTAWLERNRNRRWVTDGTRNLMLMGGEPIPEGYWPGRHL